MRLYRNPMAPGVGVCPAVILLVLLSSLPAAGQSPQVEATLAWKFKSGDTLRYRVRRLTSAVEPGPPNPLLDATLAWSVEKVDADGSAEIRQTLEHVREELTERSPGWVRVVYDSSDPKSIDNAWSALRDAVCRPLIGAPYRLRVNRGGASLISRCRRTR
jgi:hypothetical protein